MMNYMSEGVYGFYSVVLSSVCFLGSPVKFSPLTFHVILPPFLVLPYLSFTQLCFLILSLVFAFEDEYLTYP